MASRRFSSPHIQGTADAAQGGGNTNSLTLPGDPRLLSGALVGLTGWGRNDGDWIIMSSKHTLNAANGYKTDVVLERLP